MSGNIGCLTPEALRPDCGKSKSRCCEYLRSKYVTMPCHMEDTDIFTPIETIPFIQNGFQRTITRYRSVMCTSNLESKHKYLPTAVSGQSCKDMWAFRIMQHCGDTNSRIRIQRTRFLHSLKQVQKVNKLKLSSKDKSGEIRKHWDVPLDQVESIVDKRRSSRVAADPSFSPHFRWCEQHRYAISDPPLAMWMRKLAQERKFNPDLFIPIDAVQEIPLNSTRKSSQPSHIDNGERFLLSHIDKSDDEVSSTSQSSRSGVIADDISSYLKGARSISHSLSQSELQSTKIRSKTITTTTTKSNKKRSADMEDQRQNNNKRAKSIQKGKQNNARSRGVAKHLHKGMFRSKQYVTQQQAQFIINVLQPFCLDLYAPPKNTKKKSSKQIESDISKKDLRGCKNVQRQTG